MTALAGAPAEIPDLTPARRSAVLGVASLGVILVTAAIASVNVASPEISAQLRASQTDLQWIVDAYTVVLAALLLFAGALSDRIGRKEVLVAGLVVFSGASALAAEAGSAPVLIGARAAMGVGASLLFPTTLSLITTSFSAAERSKAVAVWAAAAASGAVIGLIASGALLLEWWWGSLFLLNVVLSGLCLIVALPVVPRGGRRQDARLDPGGALLAVGAIGATVYGIIEGPTRGWTNPVTVGTIGAGGLIGLVFVAYELRVDAPMLDPRIFARRAVLAGSIIIGVQYLGAFAYFLLITEYLQYILGYRPFASGLACVPVGLVIVLGSVIGGRLTGPTALRHAGAIGLELMAGACLCIGLTRPGGGYWPVPVAAMVLLGAGIGISTPLATTAITEGLPAEKQGVASALNDTTRELGAALGIAISGSLLNSGYRSHLDASAVIAHLPRPVVAAAQSSIGLAHSAVPGPAGAPLRSAADRAFMYGLHLAMFVFAGVFLIGAVAVVVTATGATSERRRAAVPALGGAVGLIGETSSGGARK